MEANHTEFPLKTCHEVMWLRNRYMYTFESARTQLDRSNLPTPNLTLEEESSYPWMIEAPLCSVEIIEALLKPPQPYKIHTAHHVRRKCLKTAIDGMQKNLGLRLCKRRYQEFRQFQGRLEKDREISFVCIPRDSIRTIEHAVMGRFWPVLLNWISIPWVCRRRGLKWLEHPWGLVLHDRSYPGSVHTVEGRLRGLLEELGISGCDFRRSFLKPGTTPIPECLWDWIEGIPGSTAALPYYTTDVEARDVATEDNEAEHTTKGTMATENSPQDGAHTDVASQGLAIRTKVPSGQRKGGLKTLDKARL